MERRRNGVGGIVAALGVILGICLLPYLISSVYAVTSVLLRVPAPTKWLWGDWLSGIVEPTSAAYRVLVELPVCGAGVLALLIIILGVTWFVSGREQEEGLEPEEEPQADAESAGEDLGEPPSGEEFGPPDVV